MLNSPIFLVGAERSGTTLLRLMLDGHPNLAFGEEFEYAVETMRDGKQPDLDEYYLHLERSRIFQTSGFEIDKSLTYKELVNSFLETRKQAKSATEVGATVHFDFPNLIKIWPNARFIHIIRDPRDVAPSAMKMGWAETAWLALDKWIESETQWEQLEALLQPEQYTTIRFDALIEDHLTELKKLCSFIGLEYSPDMLNYANETDYALPGAGVANSWVDTLNKTEVQHIEARVADMMVTRGFALSDYPLLETSEINMTKIKIENKVKSLKSRLQRHGVKLSVQDFVARKLKLSNLETKTRKQMNAQELKNLKKSWRSDTTDHTSAR